VVQEYEFKRYYAVRQLRDDNVHCRVYLYMHATGTTDDG
jgi:hypothetical protein